MMKFGGLNEGDEGAAAVQQEHSGGGSDGAASGKKPLAVVLLDADGCVFFANALLRDEINKADYKRGLTVDDKHRIASALIKMNSELMAFLIGLGQCYHAIELRIGSNRQSLYLDYATSSEKKLCAGGWPTLKTTYRFVDFMPYLAEDLAGKTSAQVTFNPAELGDYDRAQERINVNSIGTVPDDSPPPDNRMIEYSKMFLALLHWLLVSVEDQVITGAAKGPDIYFLDDRLDLLTSIAQGLGDFCINLYHYNGVTLELHEQSGLLHHSSGLLRSDVELFLERLRSLDLDARRLQVYQLIDAYVYYTELYARACKEVLDISQVPRPLQSLKDWCLAGGAPACVIIDQWYEGVQKKPPMRVFRLGGGGAALRSRRLQRRASCPHGEVQEVGAEAGIVALARRSRAASEGDEACVVPPPLVRQQPSGPMFFPAVDEEEGGEASHDQRESVGEEARATTDDLVPAGGL